MSDSASIISDVAIDEDAFADFIHSIGGVVSIGKRNRGILNWDEATLYISLLNSEKFMNFYDSQDILDWENLLGAPPKTMIEMQLGHSKGSMEMYLWLAYEFGRKWNCVVDDVNAVTLNYSEVCDRYTRLSMKQGDVSGMRQQWPAAPDEYFAFMQERGHGEIKEDDCALSLLTIQPTLCSAAGYFGDDGFYKDGPYESGAKGEVWLFGWDSTGTAFGFDSGDNWRLLEIDNMRWITRLDLSFSQFVEGLLVCYPQRPISFANEVWRDSGDVSYTVSV